MPTDRFLHNGLGTGGNTGVDAANAWQSMADMLAGVAADDNVLCYDGGSGETLAAKPTASTSGSKGSKIRFVATDASFTEGGARYTLDANSAVANALDLASYDFIEINGFNFTGGTSHGVTQAGSTNVSFIDCRFYSNAGRGCNNSGAYNIFSRCWFYSNTDYGLYLVSPAYVEYCSIFDNAGTYGLWTQSSTLIYRTLFYNNGYSSTRTLNDVYIVGCTLDDETGAIVSAGQSIMSHSIISNSTHGFEFSSQLMRSLGIAYYTVGTKTDSAANLDAIVTDVDLGSDPYPNQAGRVYEVPTSETEIINLETVQNTLNSTWESYGILPEYTVASAPTFSGDAITKLEAIGGGKLKVQWNAATGTVTRYNIYVKVTGGAYPTESLAANDTATTVILDSPTIDGGSFVDGTDYTVKVLAENSGAESSNSDELNTIVYGGSTFVKIQQTVGT